MDISLSALETNERSVKCALNILGHMSLGILKWHLFHLIYYLWVQRTGGKQVYGVEASVNTEAEAIEFLER
jgi:hypothetical protein